MITAMRKQFKSSGYKVVLLFLVGAIALGMISIPAIFKSSDSGPWAIRVNNQEISYQQFVREVAMQRERISQFRAQYGDWADMLLQSMGISADPQAIAFDSLVREELLQQFVSKAGIHLSHDYITEKIHDLPFVQQHLQEVVPVFIFEDGVLNPRALNHYLQMRGLSMSAFEKKVEDVLARTLLLEMLQSTLYIPEFDVKRKYSADTLKRSFTVATISFDKILAEEKKKEITDDELKYFYDKENRLYKRYWVPEKRQGTVWKFDAETYGISISDEEINTYYKDNKTKRFVDKKVQVRVKEITEADITDKLQEKNLTFTDVRSELAENAKSEWNSYWKSVDVFERGGSKEAQYERAAFLLRKKGDVSQVIETKEGPVILQLVERIPKTYKSLSSVRDKIKKTLTQKKFKQAFAHDMKEMMKDGVISQDEFNAFVSSHAGKKEITKSLAEADSRVSEELFKLKKNKSSFYIEGNTGIALQLDAIKKRYLPVLDTIKKEVQNDLFEERATQQIKQKTSEILAALKTRSFDEVVTEYNLEKERISDVDPADSKQVRDLQKRHLPSSRMTEMGSSGAFITHETDQDSYLIRLDSIQSIDEEEFKSAYKETKTAVKGERMRSFMEGFVASLYRNATIETNESIILASE